MVLLPENSSLLLQRLPQITDLKELIDLSCSLLSASLYLVDGHGMILAHSDEKPVCCASWHKAVAEGALSEEHRKVVLSPAVNCNVIRDKECKGNPCARLSIPISLGEGVLQGAVIFFLWGNDPSFDKQCLAMILAGALSNLLQKEKREANDAHRDALVLLKDLLDYKPGLKLYFTSALKSSEFSGLPGPYHLFVLTAGEDSEMDPENMSQRLSALSEHIWVLAHQSAILLLFREAELMPEELGGQMETLVEKEQLQACCSVGFDDLLKLRYIFEDTLSALKLAAAAEPDTRVHKSDQYLARVFLKHCKRLLPAEEYYPDFFSRLIENDRKTGKTYLQTLSAYLDNGRNTNAAAKQIYMHRNTMMQQLERIEQILGVPLDNSETAFFLQLCIRLHELE